MRISHNTRVDISKLDIFNGYGYATERILASLSHLGHVVNHNDTDAEVGIWFDQPHHWKWYGSQYRIGYHPWESTELQDGWVGKMNECDEIWTPSPVVAEWYKKEGVRVPIFVYEHGVDHKTWKPYRRVVDDQIKFLHVGGEAARKGGDIVLDAFRVAFEGRDDVTLTLKMNNPGWAIKSWGKVSIISEMMTLDELVELYHSHHVFVYPSWGEGFGFNPLQAMATGMPTICTGAWAPYRRFLNPALNIRSKLSESPWQKIHPGKMFKPDFDQLVISMRSVADNYDSFHEFAQISAPGIHKQYDWNRLTKQAFDSLERRIKNSHDHLAL